MLLKHYLYPKTDGEIIAEMLFKGSSVKSLLHLSTRHKGNRRSFGGQGTVSWWVNV